MYEILIIIIALALVYDFVNGLNDAANAISTVVATKVLRPRNAVLLATFGNFAGPFILGVHVATTIGKGIVNVTAIDEILLISALIGAVFWSFSASLKGLPISITHSLVGGLIGAAIVKGGLSILITSKVIKILLFIGVAPILGYIGSFCLLILLLWVFQKFRPSQINIYFKRLQLISASLYSLGHGANDAQNAMGIIAISLFTFGYLGDAFYVPTWVILICASTISLGTFAGGWEVIKTMGLRITKLMPVDGFAAQTGGAFTLFYSTLLGIPVSTTHVMSGSILGVGSVKRLSAVRWGIARNMIWAWLLTIPASAILSAGVYILLLNI